MLSCTVSEAAIGTRRESLQQRPNPFTKTLYCRVHVSTRLCAFSRYAHAAAAAIVVALALYRPLLILFLPAVALSYWCTRRALLLKRAESVCALRWLPDQTWIWQLKNGRRVEGQLVDATVLGSFFVLLQLRPEGQKIGVTAVPLAIDSLSSVDHRHLRARLTLWSPQMQTDEVAGLFQHHVAKLRTLVSRR